MSAGRCGESGVIAAAVVLFLAAHAGHAEITAGNVYELLEMGEMNYSVNVRPARIDWSGTERAPARRISELEQALRTQPGDPALRLELIELYGRTGRAARAVELARDGLEGARGRYEARPDERSALLYARMCAAADCGGDERDVAYQALRPFLETGTARVETCIAAVDNRMSGNDYALARRLVDFYLDVYPLNAELHFRRYLISLSANIQSMVWTVVRRSADAFLQDSDAGRITGENIEVFLGIYLGRLEKAIDTASLDEARRLDPGNYEYNLTYAVHRSLVHFFSTVLVGRVAPSMTREAIESSLTRVNMEEMPRILDALERADRLRPPRDIQIHLAYAFYHFAFGHYGQIERYARTAVRTRPDLPEGYDALILGLYSPVFQGGELDLLEVNRTVAEVIHEKIDRTGEDPYDYYVLAGLSYTNYGELPPERRPDALATMRMYLEDSLRVRPDYLPARVGMANHMILSGREERAADLLQTLREARDEGWRALVLNNLGVALGLMGRETEARRVLEQALELRRDGEKTRRAIRELGGSNRGTGTGNGNGS